MIDVGIIAIIVWVAWALLMTWRQVQTSRQVRDIEHKMETRQ
jgi:hypothetical protein